MENHSAKIMIYATITVWSILLLKDSQTFASRGNNDKWTPPPSMEYFENYEDLQKYISEKKFRSSKKLANPLDDSYINAYNFHQESPNRTLVKRDVNAEQTPQIFKFEVEDAREPDEATKKLIQMHRGRELRQEKKYKNAANLTISNRTKRSAQKTEPQLIRFEVSDAKEPDGETKELIRQSRARELRMATEQKLAPTTRSTQTPTKKIKRKRKRSRRSAQLTQPQFIRFELEDAKEPDNDIKEMIQQLNGSKTSQLFYSQSNETDNIDDSSVQESKRFFFYEAIPSKSKRVANALPIEVKKIIDMMLKDSKAQAYYKYVRGTENTNVKVEKTKPIYESEVPQIPLEENLVNIYPEQAYVQRLATLPASIHTFPVNILSPPAHPQPTGPTPHSMVIPGLINNQQYYHPIASAHLNPVAYQQPAPYLKVIPAITQVFHEVPVSVPTQEHRQSELSLNSIDNNDVSKRYPNANMIPLEPLYRYESRLNVYPTAESQQTIQDDARTNDASEGLRIQHQQALVSSNNLNREQKQINLNDMQEFQELSALIGKSPTDQIHGLAYLLAKEMQRSKRLKAQRPQDNTSPILFHPTQNIGIDSTVPSAQESEQLKILRNQPIKLSQPTLEPSPEDVNIEEHGSNLAHVSQFNSEPTVVVSPPLPTSLRAAKTLGLSPNYKGIDQFNLAPTIQSNVEKDYGLQYASKYAFGYRVRDFHSGNDFGHKQHRELDGVTRGQYHILLPDGRVQNVIYHADDTGFHADVSYETGHH